MLLLFVLLTQVDEVTNTTDEIYKIIKMSQLDLIYQHLNDDLEEKYSEDIKSEIQEFYTGKTLFITGATGFMGKILIEKLLRSCADLKCIYILMRKKGKESVEQRLRKYFQHKVCKL